ncbi:hypothetical protein [Fictibacillus enclensis]|uniref:hypothetical protein n=1 Tax=Fictibacillus enclensis TaxID=1017270 RepID=UPI0024C0531B|nr:hypothetical protein [Fictibacillus enclensis]WHY71245.1 hypothetical protein QNH15_19865 [Fictibacillus enclensis]
MNELIFNDSTMSIIRNSIYLYAVENKTISFGKECISLDEYRGSKKEQGKTGMNYFLLSKYLSVEENVLFTAKVLYELLDNKRQHVDQLFLDFANKQDITINLNVERILYLALTFLFSLGKVTIIENMIEKVEDEATL